MDVQLVIGAGAIGTATAQMLADRGERVRLVSRSGEDLSTRHRTRRRGRLQRGCAEPSRRGRRRDLQLRGACLPPVGLDWPPLAAALLRAAQTSGALLAHHRQPVGTARSTAR